MYPIIKNLMIFIVCKILFRIKYENEQVVKSLNKCMICPNHSRIYDPLMVYSKLDNTYIMAKAELFKHKLIANFLTYYNVFPVERDKNDSKALRRALKIFKDNEKAKLLIFPEGKVLKTKQERGIIKDGAVYIAAMAEIPIIPVYITARPRYFSRVLVKFGEPIYYNKKILKDKENVSEYSQKLLNAIYELEPKMDNNN